MPIYRYKCGVCSSENDQYNTIARRNNGPMCCGEMAKKVIVAPQINTNFLGSFKNPGYESPLSGNFITTKRQRRDEMKEFNVVEAS